MMTVIIMMVSSGNFDDESGGATAEAKSSLVGHCIVDAYENKLSTIDHFNNLPISYYPLFKFLFLLFLG
ncbi:unnamed protein product [Gongylonema pulchrum]|uniref:Uncharacterized protein n=1 Tax=Gongylonema pulchrum TaxID=637853 RepID=A0A183DJ99_9BILA|nr:unnamed protein product [Gongylonema pulchrum]